MTDQSTTPKPQQLQEYDPFVAQLAELEHYNATVVFDYETPAGNREARSHVYKLRQTKAAVEGVRKQLKAESLERGRRIDGEAKQIRERIEAMIEGHVEQLDAVEAREQARRDEIQARFDELTALGISESESSELLPSAMLKAQLEKLRAYTIDGKFAERMAEALKLREELAINLADCVARSEAAEAAEAERKRIEAERAEAERAERERAAASQRAYDRADGMADALLGRAYAAARAVKRAIQDAHDDRPPTDEAMSSIIDNIEEVGKGVAELRKIELHENHAAQFAGQIENVARVIENAASYLDEAIEAIEGAKIREAEAAERERHARIDRAISELEVQQLYLDARSIELGRDDREWTVEALYEIRHQCERINATAQEEPTFDRYGESLGEAQERHAGLLDSARVVHEQAQARLRELEAYRQHKLEAEAAERAEAERRRRTEAAVADQRKRHALCHRLGDALYDLIEEVDNADEPRRELLDSWGTDEQIESILYQLAERILLGGIEGLTYDPPPANKQRKRAGK